MCTLCLLVGRQDVLYQARCVRISLGLCVVDRHANVLRPGAGGTEQALSQELRLAEPRPIASSPSYVTEPVLACGVSRSSRLHSVMFVFCSYK